MVTFQFHVSSYSIAITDMCEIKALLWYAYFTECVHLLSVFVALKGHLFNLYLDVKFDCI